jgi:hypothetical protein
MEGSSPGLYQHLPRESGENHEKLQNIHSLGSDSSPGTPEYEAEVLIT